MAVAFDAVGTAQTGTDTSASVPITIGGGSNRAVVLHVLLGLNTTGITASIGGESLSIISGTDGGATTGTVILGKATTLTGAQTVSVSWTSSQRFNINALSFTGVHQTTPFNGGTFLTEATPLDISVTSVSGDLTTTGCQSTVSAPSTNQTSRWSSVTPAPELWGAGDTGPGTGTTTHTWTTSSGDEYASGANIVQSTGAAPAQDVFYVGVMG